MYLFQTDDLYNIKTNNCQNTVYKQIGIQL